MRRTVRIAIAIVLGTSISVVIATRGFGLWTKSGDAPLTLYGNVDIREVNLGFRVGGRIAFMPNEEGTRVEKGALLAKLDTRSFDDKLAGAEARIANAQAALNKGLAGNRPQDIASAEDDLAQRNAMLLAARQDYERRKSLVATQTAAVAVLEQASATYRAAEASMKAAEQALAIQRMGPRQEDIDEARAQVGSAVADRDAARTDLDDATLYAPDAGVLLTRAREPGAIVASGETVFTLTIERPMRIRAYVAEPDLGRIKPGLAVTVSTDGKRTYHGSIGFISPTAEFTPKTVETQSLRADLVYRLRVIVADPDDGLRQGQPVTVAVPDAAVRPKL